MDIKHMPSSKGYYFILVMICEISNFLVITPLKATQTIPVCDAIKECFIANYGPLHILFVTRTLPLSLVWLKPSSFISASE